MIPKYQVKTYTAAVLDYTITADVLSLSTTEILTEGVGNFSFFLPSEKGGSNVYSDIALHDKAYIYYGWNTVPANPNFIGRITNISAPIKTETGYIREYSGLSQGEVLQRWNLTDQRYTGTNASVIVAAWAGTLGLGVGDITANANQPVLEIQTKTYFDALREISDYWIDAGNQIKNDFYVDTDFDLVWQPRPLRTAGVEAVTVGTNVLGYTLTRDVKPIANYVTVYGAKQKTWPTTYDSVTEQTGAETPADDGWTGVGTESWSAVSAINSDSVATTRAATTNNTLAQDFPGITSLDLSGWKKNSYDLLTFWMQVTDDPDASGRFGVVQMYAPDVGNMYVQFIGDQVLGLDQWYKVTLPVGDDEVGTYPYGEWAATVGTPSWANVQGITISYSSVNNGVIAFLIDGFEISGCRFSSYATDAASVAAYGRRDYEMVDNKLGSDSECQQRAETILYQRKDPVVEAEVTVNGNANILVGDRIALTLPKEGITASNFDLTRVTNNFTQSGWTTTFKSVNSGNLRYGAIKTDKDVLGVLWRKMRQNMEGETIYP